MSEVEPKPEPEPSSLAAREHDQDPGQHGIISVGRPLSLAPCRDDISLHHLRQSLFPAGAWPGFGATTNQTPLAYRCLRSLALAHFGRVQAAPAILEEGSMTYINSLHCLNRNLADPACCTQDDTLLSVMILGLYEMLVLSSSTGWITHTLGLGAVMEMRGPHAFKDNLLHSVFETTRFLIILASLAISKATFLSREEWKTIPWSGTIAKPYGQTLVDVSADLPNIKEQLQACPGSPELPPAVLDILTRLSNWRKQWDLLPESQTVCVSAVDASDRQDLFGSDLHYTSILAATYVCLYDAAVIQAAEALSSIPLSNVPTPLTDMSEADFAHVRKLSREAAVEICRSIQYQLSAAHPMMGQFVVLYPLRMAWKALGGSLTKEGKWVEDMLTKFGTTKQSWEVARLTIKWRG
ncbi:hypothetical protein LTR10_024374 [Elasticomyces elasticus]|uniref:Transcription factor domain-containing protein n=1 Tax=Exophiala sideris TaxID=1016849 RepID=A0ABR0J1B5_9EURO|nr:hypothetical protein LTR10_024374 [Elasticomyces elasticus]KAK5024443.1 hypothetical protein LTS07_008734 [Exophiala sideris]KAK5030875.1 hypothetical protein LTR13_007888 [Exophiala sideris]KAK5054176.1 hypothetical protein LTR69_009138 [Exophiala sideris]KAK5179468.1 hypothetical protein LTR44_007984 [Eurotiomycetes sp. CCFEE 6388]